MLANMVALLCICVLGTITGTGPRREFMIVKAACVSNTFSFLNLALSFSEAQDAEHHTPVLDPCLLLHYRYTTYILMTTSLRSLGCWNYGLAWDLHTPTA